MSVNRATPIVNSLNLNSARTALADLFTSAKHRGGVCVITGAGVSTESGLPDYRSKGRPPYKPIQYKQFVSDDSARRRYWGRSFLGWETFSSTAPNSTHLSLAQLEARGFVNHIITQNVDQLHQRGGSEKVIDLHGILSEVVCLDCSNRIPRDTFQRALSRMNPEWERLKGAGMLAHQDGYKVGFLPREGEKVETRPDGDVDMNITSYDSFKVPPCAACGVGVLKPDVVFFGENVPRPRVDESMELVLKADSLLVIGTSLEVYSARRFVYAARDRGMPIAIVNRGPTRSDGDAIFKYDGGCTELLLPVAQQIAGQAS